MKYLRNFLIILFTLCIFASYGCGGSDKTSILPDVRGGDDTEKQTIDSAISSLTTAIQSGDSNTISGLLDSSYKYKSLSGTSASTVANKLIAQAKKVLPTKSGSTEEWVETFSSAKTTKVRIIDPAKNKIGGVFLNTDCPNSSENRCYMIGVDYTITGSITNTVKGTTKDLEISGTRYILFEKTSSGIKITRTHDIQGVYKACGSSDTTCKSKSTSSYKSTSISADGGEDSFSLDDNDFSRSKEVAVKTGNSETITINSSATRTPESWTVYVGNVPACGTTTTSACTATQNSDGSYSLTFTVPTAAALAQQVAEKIEMAISIIQETFDTSGSVEAEVITEVPAETDGSGS